MQYEEVPEPTQVRNSISIAETLWRAINDPLIGIFSDLENPATERTLCSLLDSIIRSSSNLVNVLIPTFGAGNKYKLLQKQHAAYTTWLFGVLFHVVGAPMSTQVLASSIEVQARMLRILGRLNLVTFESISNEYMNILDELLDWAEFLEDKPTLIFKKFVAEQNVIDNLDLPSFPVTVEASKNSSTQISVLKIILKTGVNCWDEDKLWNRILRILERSVPEVKFVALEIALELVKCSTEENTESKTLIAYMIEIVKSISHWESLGMLSVEQMKKIPEIMVDLLKNTSDNYEVTDLCFAIIDLIAENIIDSKILEVEACQKIKRYLTNHPRAYSPAVMTKYLRYFENCPEFSKVIVHFVIFDFRSKVFCNEVVRLSEVSLLWKILLRKLGENLDAEDYDRVVRIIGICCSLSGWLCDNGKTQAILYDECNDIVQKLRSALEKINCRAIRSIYQCFIDLMADKEMNQTEIQNILCSPWSEEPLEGQRRLVATAKSLDVGTKARAIRAITEHGKGPDRVKILSACISSTEIELSMAAVLNAVFLLKDPKISISDIMTHILSPALATQRQPLQEAVAATLGPLICFASGRAKFVRENWDSREWRIACEQCDSSTKISPDSPSLSRDNKREIGMMFMPFFNILKSKNVVARRNMSENLQRFSSHVDEFSSKKMINTWLPLVRDQNQEIRENLAKSIGTILKNKIAILEKTKSKKLRSTQGVPDELVEYVNSICNFMAETLENALEIPDDSLHCTLITTATEFGSVPLHLTERKVLNIFLITILHPNSTNTAVALASVAYREVASFHKVTPKEMYVRYKKDFLELMMRMAVSNFIAKGYNIATTVHRAAKCIGYQGSRQLMRNHGHIAICFLTSLVVKTPAATPLFHDMSDLTNMDEKEMFTEYFHHICAYVFLNEAPEFGTKCLKLISTITKIKLSDLMSGSFMGIFRELLLHFHEKMETVVRCLEILSAYDGKPRVHFTTKENVTNYLMPYLHGVLVTLDSNLSARSDEHTQKSALASLGALMRFMGARYLTPLRYKILATLRVSLSFQRPGFRELSCYAWNSFLHNINPKDLGPLLPTICISMIPLLESCPREAESMLEYIFVQNFDTMSVHISELFFIEDIKVSQKIALIVKSQIEKSLPEGFEANLNLWLRRIIHESDEVRKKALSHLKKFLGEHRSELNEMILADTDVHPLVVKLLDALLAGCQDKDEDIRLGSGECLGELGAVEPSLLPRRIVARDDSKFIADMNEDFASATLVELVRAFQMQKSTRSMDCFSLAIQEILKAYEISPTGKNSSIWDNLPSMTQQIILPFLTSHYKNTASIDQTEFPHPIYGSEAGSTFQKWAYNWVCSMSRCIKDANLRAMLNACHPAFKHDTRTMIFCIPHIVLYIVANDTENERERLTNEILAVIKEGESSRLDQELLKHRPLRLENDEKPSQTRVSDEARRVRCSQVIFSTLDHLQRWLREKRLVAGTNYNRVSEFFEKLDSLVLAQGCYQSHEYHRALMYLERHMRSTNKGLSDSTEGGLLAKIYTQLEEPDGVSGILATQDQSPTLQQMVLAHEVSGQLQDAATCYERLAQRVLTPKYVQGMIQCYLGLDQPFTAMNIAKGVLNSRPELEPVMVEHEPFWRLANFANLDENMPQKSNIKRVLLDDLKNGRMPDLQPMKKRLVSLLGAASHPGAYQQSYSYIMKLHILNEFEKAASYMLKDLDTLPAIFDEWDSRGQLVRASRGVEFVLGMRRATLKLAVQLHNEIHGSKNDEKTQELTEEIGMIWLKSAKIARKAGLYQQAYIYILSASDSCPQQQLYIEQAQLYWQKNCQEDAFTTLKRCFSNCFRPASDYKEMPLDVCEEERRQCAKAKLLFAKYNDETLNVDTSVNILNYKEAILVWCAWEKSFLACAQYFESIVNRMNEDERDMAGKDLQFQMLNYYGKSLLHGCKYIHQSMPRMLTVWLDFASRVQNNRLAAKILIETMIKMTKVVDVYLDRLPIFMWLTAFSQLVSRICHPSKEVQNTLCTILVKLILAYPQHCLWMMASVFKSSYPARQKRCLEIFNNPRLETSQMRKLIKDFNRLWEKLIELSNKAIPDGLLNTSVKVLSSGLQRLLTTPDFGPVMMPTSKFRQLHLPSKGDSISSHKPFPVDWVHITGIDDDVLVMTSLQRPRRIALQGSDGAAYLFMCKPRDDLRRDFRLMEFNGIVNKYLQKDPESRQRRLYIRTYSVVPLNEECGLIEWVPNLKRDMFLNKLLPKHPPVLGDWFRLTFPDPYGWYEARTAYIRTTAVMSMVGYILGLGDRHGENILFDTKCGDCVHVDFNCLFNRGELFDWPERVPFRLTQNMLDAMGPLKYEGPFRRSCQTTMRVLREQASILISVLTPFVYDPLVSWNRHQPGEAGEKTNEKAVEHVKNIEQRLKGLMRPQGRKSGPKEVNLSVEGQTNHLILDATNVDNLCQMYFGWGAYL
ncbi:serine/threonine-protein kinase ATR isoform X2 [Venturia canescens]|uniref:serine/threonine-protein kinase ATR isoform X2 n=1 Tax=Venturia canescens TaxID=32260 RepID=UPI001C9D5117|nr:serine/threonine-protein kinase ATR isoform X2 [Venturia canescens]